MMFINNNKEICTNKGTVLNGLERDFLPIVLFKRKYGFWCNEKDIMQIHEIINYKAGIKFNLAKSNSYYLINSARKSRQSFYYPCESWQEYLYDLSKSPRNNKQILHPVIADRVLRTLRRKIIHKKFNLQYTNMTQIPIKERAKMITSSLVWGGPMTLDQIKKLDWLKNISEYGVMFYIKEAERYGWVKVKYKPNNPEVYLATAKGKKMDENRE